MKALGGPEVAEVLMKRVRSRMQDAPPSYLSQRELGVELC
jgi:hypothetical protein